MVLVPGDGQVGDQQFGLFPLIFAGDGLRTWLGMETI